MVEFLIEKLFDNAVLLALVSLLITIVSFFIQALQEHRAGLRAQSLKEKITNLTMALQDSATLISQIEIEINERRSLVEKLEGDAKRYNEIAKLKQSEVEAVAQVLRGDIQRENRKSFWQQLTINFLFFLLGVIMTIVLSQIGLG
jgi:hypothetical protein